MPSNPQALKHWQDKLVFLQIEEAKTSNANQRFQLRNDIEEAQAKIAEFSPATRPEQALDSKPEPALDAGPPDFSRLDQYVPARLLGREAELMRLHQAWQDAQTQAANRAHILAFIALGGEGKTSLIGRWAIELARDKPLTAFAWSFYNQGTGQQAASADLFIDEALRFFGDAALAASGRPAAEKGRRLADLVSKRRALLLLDGVEPLQYPPGSPLPGQLQDAGLAALLKSLAVQNFGLAVVTSRYRLADLNAYPAAVQDKLQPLSQAAGVALLQAMQTEADKPRKLRGTEAEFKQLVADLHGHALSLTLIGSYLLNAHHGDLRRRDRVTLADADRDEQNGHAFHVMDAYVRWFERADAQAGEALLPAPTGSRAGDADNHPSEGQKSLALLRLLGLFDRPADAGCLDALLAAPAIDGLTAPLFTVEKRWFGLKRSEHHLKTEDLHRLLTRLEAAHLLSAAYDDAGQLQAVDAHPLLRAYFAARLRLDQPAAWCDAHERLYRHLYARTPDLPAPQLADLQPLYQAIAHGCCAGLQQEVCDEVYFARILRRNEYYSTRKLGAFGMDLAAVACFFDKPWDAVSPALTEADQAWLLNEAATRLRGVGRLREATQPMRVSGEMDVKAEKWKGAAISYNNLSELQLTLGDVDLALASASAAVDYADRSGDASLKMAFRSTLADAQQQAGQTQQAEALFQQAEAMQAERQPDYPLLYSVRGFKYCDLLLTAAERAAWDGWLQRANAVACPSGRATAAHADTAPATDASAQPLPTADALLTACHAIAERAAQTLEWAENAKVDILSIALDHLSLARAALYAAMLDAAPSPPPTAVCEAEAAVDGLRRAGQLQELPRGLLTRALLRGLQQRLTGPDSAQTDLDEAYDIAERGPMPLFQADIHLHRARLFPATAYPWQSPATDLKAARHLIEKHRYGRRLAELADAEAALR